MPRVFRRNQPVEPGYSFRTGPIKYLLRKNAPAAERTLVNSVLWWTSWLSLVLTIAVALAIRWSGDTWWLTAVLTFGPRFLVLVPIVLLIVAAAIFSRRSLVPLLLTLGVALGPVMGFCVPWRSLVAGGGAGRFVLRVVTLNPGGGVDWETFETFLAEVNPDVVAFQEFPSSSGLSPTQRQDWHTARHGQLYVISKFPILQTTAPTRETEIVPIMCCELQTPAGSVNLNCLHLHTVRDGLDALLERWEGGAARYQEVLTVRNRQSQIAARFAELEESPAIVLGDFNTTGDSPVFRQDWGSWQDAFRVCGWGLGHTFGTRRAGVRIDHILASSDCVVRSCRVGPDLQGQHRPVFAEVALPATR